MKRSLIALQALLASSAVLCNSAEASSIYNAPDKVNSLESRIENARNGNWSSLLKSVDLDGQLVAKSKWGNGGGHKFKNSRGNGKGGSKWSNSRPKWGNGGYRGGWANGGGWKNGGGGFVNW